MLSTSYVDSWLENSVGLEEKIISAATGTKDLAENSVGYNGSGSDNLDDSLTSLQWLQEFSILTSGRQNMTYRQHQSSFFGQQLGTEAPASPLAGDTACIGKPLTPGKPVAAAFCRIPTLSTLPSLTAHGHCPDEVDYKTNPHIKPPYSYATLICMAMKASKKSKITLSWIYKWITDNFSYFRYADPTWQNSIRHNLSLNKCFIKVPRQKDEPGKGGFWKIDPQYAERILTGAFKKRRMPPVYINPALQNQLIRSSQSAETEPTVTAGVFNIGPESQPFRKEFEEIPEIDQDWERHLAEANMFDWWDLGNKHKRRESWGHHNGGSNYLHLSSSPLQVMEEPKVLGSLKSNFDWDALLDSALNGELSLNEGDPLSPVPQDQDLTVHDIPVSSLQAPDSTAVNNMAIETPMSRNIDFDEETFLATEFLHSHWAEADEGNNADFLCSSTGNIDQLFDFGDSLRGDSKF